MKKSLYSVLFIAPLAIIPVLYGCKEDDTQKRLEYSRNSISQRLQTKSLLPNERSILKHIHNSLQASNVQSLETPVIAYVEFRVLEKRMWLIIHWIAKTPNIDSVKVESVQRKYSKIFPIEKWERDALFKEARSWVGYDVEVLFIKGNIDGQKILALLQTGEVTASIMFNGKVISNKMPITVVYWDKKGAQSDRRNVSTSTSSSPVTNSHQ